MRAVAEENGVLSPGDDGWYDRGDAGAMLNRKIGRGAVAERGTEGALDAVAETGVRTPLGALWLPAAAVVTVLGRTAATPVLTAFRSRLLVRVRVVRRYACCRAGPRG